MVGSDIHKIYQGDNLTEAFASIKKGSPTPSEYSTVVLFCTSA